MQEKLLLIRKKRNIPQHVLANLIGVSVAQYSKKEKGKYQFNCNEMFAIANFLEMNLEDIFLPTIHQNGVKNK